MYTIVDICCLSKTQLLTYKCKHNTSKHILMYEKTCLHTYTSLCLINELFLQRTYVRMQVYYT